jgi:ATP-binding protein involved in chromosome partitioning
MNSSTHKPIIIAHRIKGGLKRIPQIKNIIAITSGKGGVGKSTTAINLALGLAKTGAAVGLLDADIYGPSIPMLVGETMFKPEVSNNNFTPLNKFGLRIMSFGFLIAPTQPAIWRGAMVNKALKQLLYDTEWGNLDYLIIDMPPGTGDIHLTFAQSMPITATVVVTTPQDIALIDVGKSINMFKQLEIPCLGIIENMATHICENCGHQSNIFGLGGSAQLKEEYNLPVLGRLPLNLAICQHSDNGIPIATIKDSPLSAIYQELAINVAQQLANLPKDHSSKLSAVSIVKKS